MFFNKKKSNSDISDFLKTELSSMYRVAMSYTKNPVDAEDLVHDTVLRALRYQDKYQKDTNFKAWIYTILTRIFFHNYNSRKRKYEIKQKYHNDIDQMLHQNVSTSKDLVPEKIYLQSILSEDILKAIDSLPNDFSMVVILSDIEGLSYKDIAEIIDSPVGTVMSRLHRGRKLLKQKLHDIAISEGIIKPSKDKESTETSPVLNIKNFKRV